MLEATVVAIVISRLKVKRNVVKLVLGVGSVPREVEAASVVLFGSKVESCGSLLAVVNSSLVLLEVVSVSVPCVSFWAKVFIGVVSMFKLVVLWACTSIVLRVV